MKQVAGQLRLDLAQYRELEAFAQFGSDLDTETQAKLDRGARMQELLKQDQYDVFSVADQVSVIYAGSEGYLDKIEIENIRKWEREFLEYMHENYSELMKKINQGEKIEGKIEDQLRKAIDSFEL